MKMHKTVNYGTIIKLNRENQNMSLSVLAKDSGLSIGQLSKIENCIEGTTEEVYAKIFDALDLDFELIKKKQDDIKYQFYDIYKSIVFLDDENQIKNAMLSFIDDFSQVYLSVDVLLIRLIYNRTYSYDDNECDALVSLLKKIVSHVDPDYQSLFYTYDGLFSLDKNNLDKALIYLELAIDLSNNPMITAMAHYFIGQIYRKKRRILKSSESLFSARSYFVSTGNFRRCVLTNILIANLYCANNEFNDAIELYKKCIEDFSRINIDIYSRSITYLNIVWAYILQDKFLEGYQVLNDMPEQEKNYLNESQNKTYALFQVIIFNQIGKKDEAFSICKSFHTNYSEDDYNDNYLMYFYYLYGQKKVRLKFLNKNKTLIKRRHDYAELRLLFKFLEKEITSEKQMTELKKLYYDYIFNQLD